MESGAKIANPPPFNGYHPEDNVGVGDLDYCTKLLPPREICIPRNEAQVETGTAAEARMRRGSGPGLRLLKVSRFVYCEWGIHV